MSFILDTNYMLKSSLRSHEAAVKCRLLSHPLCCYTQATMRATGYQRSSYALFVLALMVFRVRTCQIASGSDCEKAPFVPGHNLAGEGFDVVRMRRTGAYVINVKGHLADNHTCTLCANRFQKGQVKIFSFIYSSKLPFYRFSSSFCNQNVVFSPFLRFRSSQQLCLTGVPSVAAASSCQVRSTTRWTPCCAAPAPWLTITGDWV